jgi:hypothetical protein
MCSVHLQSSRERQQRRVRRTLLHPYGMWHTVVHPRPRPARQRAGYSCEGRLRGLIAPAQAGLAALAGPFTAPAGRGAEMYVTPSNDWASLGVGDSLVDRASPRP